jgi:sugar-specific transcriptional regulator TrmB
LAVQDEDAQTLTRLGLTALQAKTYLALLKLGKATGRTLSQHSKVARQEAYRLLAELQEKGLVEKILGVPTEFKPIPIEDCLFILIERKKSEISETQKKATKLLQNLKEKNSSTLQEEESQFILVPRKGNYFQKMRKVFENSQTSIDAITTSRRFLSIMFIFGQDVEKALKRSVKMRILTEKPEDENSLPENVKALRQNPLYRVRYLPTPPLAPLLIIDKKEVTIVTSPNTELNESPTLWSNSPSLIAVFRGYFETAWITAMEQTSSLPPTQLKKQRSNFP